MHPYTFLEISESEHDEHQSMGWGVPIIVARAAVTRDPLTALDGVPRNLGHGFQRGPRLPGMLPPQPRFWSEIDPELVDPELSKQPI